MEVAEKPTALAVIETQALAIIQEPVNELKKLNEGLIELATRYGNVAYDLTTTKGDTEARQARDAIRQVRYKAHNIRKDTVSLVHNAMQSSKDKVNEVADAIIERVKAVEDPIDQQIKADELRREREKEEARRLAAEIAAKTQVNIDAIRDYLVKASGKDSIAIGVMATELATMPIELEIYGDRMGEALQLRRDVCAKLMELAQAALAAEGRAAELRAQEEELAAQRLAFAEEQRQAREAQAEREAQEKKSREAREAHERAEREAKEKKEREEREAFEANARAQREQEEARQAAERKRKREIEEAAAAAAKRVRDAAPKMLAALHAWMQWKGSGYTDEALVHKAIQITNEAINEAEGTEP